MSEMIERVARALFNYEQKGGMFSPKEGEDDGWNGPLLQERGRDGFRRKARAAIEAMREPTDDMKSCSDEIHWGYSCHVCGGLTDGWQKMIDAALK